MIHWKKEEIEALDSPFLTVSFLEEIKKDFEPTYRIFKELTTKNPTLFIQ